MRRRWNAGDASIRELERTARLTGSPIDAMAWGQALRRAGELEPDVADHLDVMGPEAWSAWLLGGEFEWRPASADGGVKVAQRDGFVCQDPAGPDCHDDACPLHYGDDDEGGLETWRLATAATGLAVRRADDGSPMVVRTHWMVDGDGNWDAGPEDEWPVGSPQEQLAAARWRRDVIVGWIDYFHWVVQNREDPLRQCNVALFQPTALSARARARAAGFGVDLRALDDKIENELEPAGASVIYDRSTSLFWNNDVGWVDFSSAETFVGRRGVELPIDGEWVMYSDAVNLPHDEDCSCDPCETDRQKERLDDGMTCRSCDKLLSIDEDQGDDGEWEDECRDCRLGGSDEDQGED